MSGDDDFITKYTSSPDPSLKKIVHILRILNVFLLNNTITLENHLDELKFDPNKPLIPYNDMRLYLRVVNYGFGAANKFESWATEEFLI